MLTIVNGNFQYDTQSSHVLENINLEIKKGEFVSIVGKSGCGKSTLLRIIAKLLHLSSGQYLIKGDQKKPQIGWIPQFPVLMPNMNVEQNIKLPLKCIGKKISSANIQAIIEQYKLQPYSRLFPHQISGGTKQKVSIARAIAISPDILLMDEPFSAIDAYTRDVMNIELATKLRSEKVTTIFVTHSLEEAVFLSDRILVMSPHLPSTIVKEMNILFDGKRDLKLRDSVEYAKNVAKLRHYLFELINHEV